MAKISSVKDPLTGSNYGGVSPTGSGVNASYQEYIDNLMTTVQRPVSGPLKQDQYTPSGGSSPVVGQISTPSLGSTPIFGSGAAMFPMAVLDQHKKAKQEAELKYLEEVGDVSMDNFKMNSTLKNPWHNQAFNSKYQNTLDTWLDASAARFGGDYMKGMKALKMDKDFYSTMKSYEDYANIYNSVYESAVEILSTDPKEKYASTTARKSAQKFIQDYENLDDLPIDELVRRARNFKTTTSVYKIAENAMEGIGERVREGYTEVSDMSTDDLNAWIKTTSTGLPEKELKELYEIQLEAYPWIKGDKVAEKLLWQEMNIKADKSYEQSMETIKKDTAAESTYLKKNGVNVAEDGSIQTTDDMQTMFTPFERGLMGKVKDGFVYPQKSPSGVPVMVNPPPSTVAKVMVPNDQGEMEMYTVALPGTFAMSPKKEYTANGAVSGSGRYVEGIINFVDEGLYARENMATPRRGGEVGETVATGGRSAVQAEKQPVMAKDLNTGNSIALWGDYTVAIPMNAVIDELNAAYPFLQRMHNDIDSRTPSGGFDGTKQTTAGKEPKVQGPGDKVGKTHSYKNGNKAAKDKASWSAGDIVEVDGKIYKWNGSKLKAQ